MSQQDIEQLKADMATIKRALIGDKEWQERGLLKRVDSLEHWRANVSLKVAFYSGIASGIVVLAKAAFDYFANHH